MLVDPWHGCRLSRLKALTRLIELLSDNLGPGGEAASRRRLARHQRARLCAGGRLFYSPALFRPKPRYGRRHLVAPKLSEKPLSLCAGY